MLSGFGLAAILIACGSRGPLDDGPIAAGDGGEGGAPGSSSGALGDGATPIVDAGRTLEAGPLACAGCVVGTCGQSIVACLGDPGCLGMFQCITTTCLGGGGDGGSGGLGGLGSGSINATCLLGCATKNPSGALQVLQVFQCVSGTCGADCGSVLGGLGGLGGGLGGLGGLGGGGGQKLDELPIESGPIDREAFEEVFSPWPALMSRE